ncbi:MAG: hypothetical protein ACH37Z_11440 [Anaerolineae bacterium]
MRKFLIAFLLLTAIAWAVAGDVAVFKKSGTTYWRINSAGDLIPATTLSYSVGNNTLRADGLYANWPVGANITTTNLTLTAANCGIVTFNAAADRTLTIPTAASAGPGAWIRIIDTGGNISSSGNLTVNVTSGGTINGGSSFSVNNATYEQADLYSNGSAWFASVSTKTN